MKKTLIALAAFAAVSAFAQSSVTMYGVLDVGFGASTVWTIPGSGNFQQQSSVNSTSRIGFKGTEDLGGGMKANFGLETGGINMEDGTTGGLSFARGAWVGVEGAFGEIKLGRITSKATAVMAQFDLNGISGTSAAVVSGLSAVTWGAAGSSRRNSQLQYTKVLGDVTVHFANTLAEDGGAGQNNRVTLGATYASGPFGLGAVVETAQTAAERSAVAFGASYDMKVAKVALTYVQREKETLGQGVTVGVIAPMGAANVGIQFASNNGSAAVNKNATELFANYALSKRTSVYIDSVFANSTTDVATKGYNLGVKHAF